MTSDTEEKFKILLGAFADEAATSHAQCHLGEIFAVMNTLGINYWTPRWGYHPGQGKNINIADTQDHVFVREVKKLSDEHGLQIQVLGSTLLKHALFESDTGKQQYIPEDEVLERTKHVIENAQILEAPFIRGFAGYAPGKFRSEAMTKSVHLLARVGEVCGKSGINYVIEPEPEPSYIGNTARKLILLAKGTGLDNVVLLHNGSNFHVQGLNAVAEADELLGSKRLVGVHVKSYGKQVGPGDIVEDCNHVPVSRDKTGYKQVFQHLTSELPEPNRYVQSLGGQGFFVTLAPRLAIAKDRPKYEGPRTMRVAYDALAQLLGECGFAVQ